MRLSFVAWAGVALSAAFLGCGGGGGTSTGGSGGGGGQSSSSSSSSSSASSSGVVHGDCLSDSNCSGGTCTALTEGGYKICMSKPAEATACTGSGDACCNSAECTAGGPGAGCYAAIDLQFCGGAFPEGNRCVSDVCQSDTECGTTSICAPSGAFGVPFRTCVLAYCRTDADCTAQPGGICKPIGENPCCTLPAPDGLGCTYPGGCQVDADCPGGRCGIDTMTGEATCLPPGPGCPG